ncbi:MAG: hypothetical protein QME74_02865 [Candidatus Edwardsbacteria bacterium]|nr:hypothetical protein [Candidatus Edwardsbacteria bacterium]
MGQIGASLTRHYPAWCDVAHRRAADTSARPHELQKLESESYARILEVEFEDGTKAIVPRANVELIED